jgi:2OG-Fe(II) oxygenase superfamily
MLPTRSLANAALVTTLAYLTSSFEVGRMSTSRHHLSVLGGKRVPKETTSSPSQYTSRHVLVHNTPFFGNLYRIRLPGQDDQDESFLGSLSVPTFAATGKLPSLRVDFDLIDRKLHTLEGSLGQGPAFVLENVFSTDECRSMICTCEQIGFGEYKAGKNHHGAMQILVSSDVTDRLSRILRTHVDLGLVQTRRKELDAQNNPDGSNESRNNSVKLSFAGLNRRWRVYRYTPGRDESFAPHIDAGFPPSGLSEDGSQLVWDDSASFSQRTVSRLTVLFYLNSDFAGGETKFYKPVEQYGDDPNRLPLVLASVRPVEGACLVFPQAVGESAVEYARQFWPLHEGSPVLSGRPKYVIRSDILFSEEPSSIGWDPDH